MKFGLKCASSTLYLILFLSIFVFITTIANRIPFFLWLSTENVYRAIQARTKVIKSACKSVCNAKTRRPTNENRVKLEFIQKRSLKIMNAHELYWIALCHFYHNSMVGGRALAFSMTLQNSKHAAKHNLGVMFGICEEIVQFRSRKPIVSRHRAMLT